MKRTPDNESRIRGAAAAAASLANAVDAALCELRAELRSEISELREELEELKETERVGDAYLTIDQVCAKYAISRSTVYRMIEDPDLGLRELIIRVPPVTGPRRLPAAALEEIFRSKEEGRTGKTKRNERNA
jgi:hypothetical protein